MVEETIRLPNSPDVNRSWRRISTGKLSFLYTEEKILPNYLRSPTASCHDACKYGRKHESEDKPLRVSPLKRVNRSFSGTINLDSPLRKKALTKPPAKGDLVVSFDDSKSQGICDVREKKNAMSILESRVVDSTKRKKKTVSQSLKTFGVSRGRAKYIVEHNKRVTALKLKSVAHTAAMALRPSTVNSKPKAAEPKKAILLSRARSLRTKKERSSLSVPAIKARKQVDDKCEELVEAKTFYVIRMETENESAESDQNHRCGMDSPADDPSPAQLKSQDEAEDYVIEEGSKAKAGDESSEEEGEEYVDDDDVSFSEDQNRTKTFKRGKIVNFGSQENSPRKLKFKKGKVVTGADLNSKSSSRRSLKTKENNLNKDHEQQDKPKSFKAVLKHQEIQKKRDLRALLFNNVIEETANKLVETRKSKVKALVGAFESVLSLQEKKYSPRTT